MTSQKQWLSRTQTVKKKAAHMAQDQNASAFEPIVEIAEETLTQVTGGSDKYIGKGSPNHPLNNDLVFFDKSRPGFTTIGDGAIYHNGKWSPIGAQ